MYTYFIRQEGLIDISVDDDLSGVIDFGVPVKLLWVWVPVLTAATTIDIEVSYDEHKVAGESATPTNFATISTDIAGGSVTGEIVSIDAATDVTGFRWFRLASSAAQAGDRAFVLGAVPV